MMTEQIPESRTYVHRKCGEATEVDGGDFKNMASPVPGMLQTVCASCGRAFTVSEFQWEDTGEDIIAYYDRYRVRVPALTRLLCSRKFSTIILLIGFSIGVAAGVWAWNSLGTIWGIVIGVFSVLVGMIASLVIWDSVTDRILSRSLSVPDVRCLK